MSAYSRLARRYDALTRDVDYKKRRDFIAARLPEGDAPVLELGCGTGSLTVLLAQKGCSMVGVDTSSEMLALASQKAARKKLDILLVEQDIINLELPAGFRAAVAMLDVFNHLSSPASLQAVFNRLAAALLPGGALIFDLNTEYKHREVLADNCFVFEQAEFFCVWQNRLHKPTARVDMRIDLFERRAGGAYERSQEAFSEYCYSEKAVGSALEKAGFLLLELLDGDSYAAATPVTQRLLYFAKRI